jgi:hypothetical protein
MMSESKRLKASKLVCVDFAGILETLRKSPKTGNALMGEWNRLGCVRVDGAGTHNSG